MSVDIDGVRLQRRYSLCSSPEESFGGLMHTVVRAHQTVQLRIGEQIFCGTCKQTLLCGEVDHPDVTALTRAERSEGKILTCCAIPLTDAAIGPLYPD